MNIRAYICTAVFLFFICIPSAVLADLIIFKNGNELKVEKAWLEDDQVCFIFNKLKASIPQSKIARIDNDSKKPVKSATPNNHGSTAKTNLRVQPDDKFLTNKAVLKTTKFAVDQQKTNLAKMSPPLRPDGIGDLKWGAHAADVSGLRQKHTDSGLKDVVEYLRPKDGLKLGEAELTSIVYAFWRDRLYTVTLWTRGPSNYKALRQKAFDRFGRGSRPDAATERYLWSNGDTDMMLKYTNEDQYGFLWMRGKEIDRKFKLSRLSGHTSYLRWMKSRK